MAYRSYKTIWFAIVSIVEAKHRLDGEPRNISPPAYTLVAEF